VAVLVEMILLVEEMRLNGTVGCAGILVEKVGEGVAAEIVVDVFVDMLVTVGELCSVEFVVGVVRMLVDDTIVAFVDKDCVVMLVVLEEVCIVGVLVSGAVVPVENNWKGAPVEITVGVVKMLLPVGELWTVGDVTFVNLFVTEMDGVAENFVEVVDMLLLV